MINNKETLMERLEKCGCCKHLIEQIQPCERKEDTKKIMNLLKECQMTHQQEFDEVCRHIDCIDYLIYKIERKNCRK